MATSNRWTKHAPGTPDGFVTTEAAGLRWLSEAGAVPVVRVLEVSRDALVLERLTETAPSEEAATAFGRDLARLHGAGAPSFGALPPGAESYFFGPVSAPMSLPTSTSDDFGTFYAEARIEPLVEACHADGSLDAADETLLRRLCEALRSGAAERDRKPVRPARVHGDLWSGNVMWTASGVTLIDPAACGNHPLADLAMLEMFGCPFLDEVITGYESVRPLPKNWREELPLHQLFGYLVHLHLFGMAYHSSVLDSAQKAAAFLGW